MKLRPCSRGCSRSAPGHPGKKAEKRAVSEGHTYTGGKTPSKIEKIKQWIKKLASRIVSGEI